MRDANENGARRGVVKLVGMSVMLIVATAAFLPFWWGPKPPPQPVVELPPYQPVPVPTNRGEAIVAGFRGEVHPLLHGRTSLEVTAHWTSLGQGRDQLERNVPPAVYKLFTELKPATPTQVYTERELSALLPASIETVGQVWEIDGDKVAGLLRQFHASPSMHLVAFGRRAGPDGAFAVLRAVSPTHLEILFRVHAEFDVAQNVWLTPACFWGRMIVNKEAGTVEHLRLWVPTDNPLNVHLTVAESTPKGGKRPAIFRKIQRGDFVQGKRDIVRVEQMELVSTSAELPESLTWSEEIGVEVARQMLKQAFYTFENIDWVPWQETLAIADAQKKPVLAIVLWGALDDQSC